MKKYPDNDLTWNKYKSLDPQTKLKQNILGINFIVRLLDDLMRMVMGWISDDLI